MNAFSRFTPSAVSSFSSTGPASSTRLAATSIAASTCSACAELGSSSYQVRAASSASSGSCAWFATSTARRAIARVAGALGEVEVGLGGERKSPRCTAISPSRNS